MKKLSKRQVVYLLFTYIILQFLWWEILLVKIHHQNIEKEKQLMALKITDLKRFEAIEKQLNKEQQLKIIMIVGEGTVFLILILFGFYKLLKAYERDIVVSERQTHFLLSLPHEIKTPLSVIQLNLQTLLQNKNISDEQKNSLNKKSLEELKRLQVLVEQLLLTNKISKDKYHVHSEKINLSEQLKLWIKSFAEQKEVKYDLEENVFVYADKYLTELMFNNLMSNAVKFSDKYVSVKLYSDKKIFLEIMNDGELIRESEREKIFELFYRRETDEDKGIKGTGLGLYLVKQIAELQKIKINVFVKSNHNVFQVVF